MKKTRKNSCIYLIDIGYKKPMNSFYEFYGNSVSYAAVEQESYIDLKNMVYEIIGEKINFRKHERSHMVLTLKVEMTEDEKEKFAYLLNEGKFRFFHEYEIKDFRNFKKENIDE